MLSPLPAMWVEKYRPTTFDDVVDQDAAVKKLKFFLKTGTLPHMIFTGPPGTGKTSAAHILVKTMFPKEVLDDRVLELNASEERGIKTVRGKIKRFVSSSVKTSSGKLGLSIVILDEADALTLDSQYALRRVMEDSSKNSRFILICNYLNKIITPLLSRCAVIHFNTLSTRSVNTILHKVCDAENVPDNIRKQLAEHQYRDARTSINLLQRMVLGNYTIQDNSYPWKKIVQQEPIDILESVNNLLLDGHDVDTLIENFVSWGMENNASPTFLEHAVTICGNVANHGTPIIQFTSLLLAFSDEMK